VRVLEHPHPTTGADGPYPDELITVHDGDITP
jgi:hypothetical protein